MVDRAMPCLINPRGAYKRAEELLRYRRLLLYSHSGGLALTTEDNEGFWWYQPPTEVDDTPYRLVSTNYWAVPAE